MSRTLHSDDIPRPMVWPAKDADEVETYHIDFGSRLLTDTISSATFSLPTAAGLVIDDSEHDSVSIASVTLSAGTAGSKGKILCRIVSSGGRTLDQTVALPIRAR